MKNSELKEYLNMFPNDIDVSFLIANPVKRKIYGLEQIELITGLDFPVLGIIIGSETDMDRDMVEVCKEHERVAEQLAEQTEITDIPELMP